MEYVVTHPGEAHLDEFLAVGLLLLRCGAETDYYIPVHRRNPTDCELGDPDIAVVDVGGRYEHDLMNFDHHQFPLYTAAPTCALTLVMRYCGFDCRRAREDWPWLEFLERYDTVGPADTALWLGMPQSALKCVFSPVEAAVLNMFSKREGVLGAHDFLYEALLQIAGNLFDDVPTKYDRLRR